MPSMPKQLSREMYNQNKEAPGFGGVLADKLRTVGGAFTDPQFYQDIGDRLMKSHIISGLVGAVKAPYQAYTGELDPTDPRAVLAANDVAMTALGGGTMFAPRASSGLMGLNVYHGSPHRFDKFDMSKIGTGEGEQAYGHGLYFSESKKVADSYAGKLSKPEVVTSKGFSVSNTYGLSDSAKNVLAQMQKIAESSQYEHRSEMASKILWNAPYSVQTELIGNSPRWKAFDVVDSGSLYKIDLPDEHIAKMLDWDKPLSQQPQSIRNALQSSGYKPDAPDITGSQVLMDFEFQHGGKAQASAKLRELGIPGVKYLDQGSRGAGQGTYNFVVFDDQIPKIIGQE